MRANRIQKVSIVRNNNHCAFTIIQNVGIVRSVKEMNVLCNGGSTGSIDLTVTGGSGSYTYLWSNSATTQDISGLSEGTYTVVITESNSCTVTGTTSFTITQNDLVVASGTQMNVLCNGGSTGSIDLSVVGGSGSYTYLWSNAAETQDISGLAAGTYTVCLLVQEARLTIGQGHLDLILLIKIQVLLMLLRIIVAYIILQ